MLLVITVASLYYVEAVRVCRKIIVTSTKDEDWKSEPKGKNKLSPYLNYLQITPDRPISMTTQCLTLWQ